MFQKLQERTELFKRTPDISSREREKLGKVLISEFMSSEESCDSDDVMISVKTLPWRSSKITKFFTVLNEKAQGMKSEQAKRQTKRRIVGGVSTRPRPQDASIPSWAFTKN